MNQKNKWLKKLASCSKILAFSFRIVFVLPFLILKFSIISITFPFFRFTEYVLYQREKKYIISIDAELAAIFYMSRKNFVSYNNYMIMIYSRDYESILKSNRDYQEILAKLAVKNG